MGDDRLEDAAVVVGMVTVFGWQYDVATLVADEVLVVWGNQQELAFAEAACATIIGQVKFSAR